MSLRVSEKIKRGKGYWKFKNNLLTDKEYVTLVNNKILEIKNNVHMIDKKQFQEYVKCQIRTDMIFYSSTKAKINKQIENDLRQKLQDNNTPIQSKMGRRAREKFKVFP